MGAFQKLLSIGVSCFMHFGSKTQLFSNILQYFTSSHACLFISKFQHCIGSTSPFFLQRVGKSWQRNTFPALTRWQIPRHSYSFWFALIFALFVPSCYHICMFCMSIQMPSSCPHFAFLTFMQNEDMLRSFEMTCEICIYGNRRAQRGQK